ncbi:DNA-directed RNA polymerase, partial [Teratosphaeriaceae sp. CCFEE 6253]
MEETSVDIAIDRWRKADADLKKMGIHTAMQTKPMGALMWQWYQALLPLLKAELAAVRELLQGDLGYGSREDERSHYGPLLECLPMEKVAATTILTALTFIARGKDRETAQYEVEVKITNIATNLGTQLEGEVSALASLKAMAQRKAAGL